VSERFASAPTESSHPNMQDTNPREDKSTEEMESYLNDLKKSLRNHTRDAKFLLEMFGAFVVLVYTGFTIAMYCANRDAADAAKSAADTAKESADLTKRTLEGTQAAVMRIYGFNPDGDDNWSVVMGNAGKVGTPELHVKYSVVRLALPSGKIINEV